jgi:hypothetical protein
MVSSIDCKRSPQGRIICQADDGIGYLLWISLPNHQSRFSVFNYILHGWQIGRHHRAFAPQRFDEHQPKTLPIPIAIDHGRKDHDASALVQCGKVLVGSASKKFNMAMQPQVQNPFF